MHGLQRATCESALLSIVKGTHRDRNPRMCSHGCYSRNLSKEIVFKNRDEFRDGRPSTAVNNRNIDAEGDTEDRMIDTGCDLL
ncbi:hypothetical protein EVAR_97570_1 [Eumeta japonica]|uniref:Uncharacterized protein n=1 Tax=Eumeta variegata TaxID=151549 RepID=A0A4C1WS74_EUMVA|nr:hypothetical protein EVAR_97570_1 [Eumeta japonica]